MATDSSGHCFVAGGFRGAASFGSTNLTSAGGLDVFVAKYDPAGVLEWVRQGAETGNHDTGDGITVDATDNCYVTGGFGSYGGGTSTLNFDAVFVTNQADRAVFAAKFSPAGQLVWLRQFGGSGSDVGSKIQVSQDGALYAAGWFENTVGFGTNSVTSAGGRDIFLACFNPDAENRWVRRLGGPANNEGKALAIDPAGQACVVGTDDLNWGSWQVSGLIVASFDTNGALRWQRSVGGTFYLSECSVAADRAGSFYVTCGFQGLASFDDYFVTSAGAMDVCVAKFDPQGTLQWVQNAGQSGEANALDILIDRDGNAVLTGRFTGTSRFGSTALVSAGQDDVFLAKLATAGEVPLVQLFPSRAGGPFTIGVSGPAGLPVILEASTDLAHWTACASNAPPDGLWYHTVPATHQPGSFFRAVGP